jgi:sec-independent protein translocase protein TatC
MTKEKLESNEDLGGSQRMSFFEHLEELRWHLLRAVSAVILSAIVLFIFKDFLFERVIFAPRESWFPTNSFLCELAERLKRPALCINNETFEMISIKMAGQFMAHIKISVIAGFLLSFPYVVFELWKFISPGLFKHEKKSARKTMMMISFLFFLGVIMGYYVIVPISINFLGNYSVSPTVENQIYFTSYINLMSSICFASGLIFQLPVISYFLTNIGILTPVIMRKYRKHSIVVILLLSAIITPPDMFSQILLSLPLLLLYEISIRISKKELKKREKKAIP